MSKQIIQCNYDTLSQISQTFKAQSEQLTQLMQLVQRCVEGLARGDWVGSGADAFQTEMVDLVFPGIVRLESALDDSGRGADQIRRSFMDAEVAAGLVFVGIDTDPNQKNMPTDSEPDESLLGQIEAMQRVYHVAPRYEQVRAIIEDGVDSAESITSIPPETFVDQPDDGGSEDDKDDNPPHH